MSTAIQQNRKYCKVCQGYSLHGRPGVNHILHLLLTMVTCFWAVVWISLILLHVGGWRCQTCGYAKNKWITLVGVLLVIVFAVCLSSVVFVAITGG